MQVLHNIMIFCTQSFGSRILFYHKKTERELDISRIYKLWVQESDHKAREKSLWHQRANIQSVCPAEIIEIYDIYDHQ